MTPIRGDVREIHELARYEVRPDALERRIGATHEFVAYVHDNESGALRYEVWQDPKRPTRLSISLSGETPKRIAFTVSLMP